MGRLLYNSTFEVNFPDRILAHVQIVIGAKLSKSESFFFSWRDSRDVGGGRTALWIHPAIPLHFRYDHGAPARVNPEWIRHLIADSYTSAGLQISDEPVPAPVKTPALR